MLQQSTFALICLFTAEHQVLSIRECVKLQLARLNNFQMKTSNTWPSSLWYSDNSSSTSRYDDPTPPLLPPPLLVTRSPTTYCWQKAPSLLKISLAKLTLMSLLHSSKDLARAISQSRSIFCRWRAMVTYYWSVMISGRAEMTSTCMYL